MEYRMVYGGRCVAKIECKTYSSQVNVCQIAGGRRSRCQDMGQTDGTAIALSHVTAAALDFVARVGPQRLARECRPSA